MHLLTYFEKNCKRVGFFASAEPLVHASNQQLLSSATFLPENHSLAQLFQSKDRLHCSR